MWIAFHEIGIEVADFLFNPQLIAATAATWLLLVTGTAGRLIVYLGEVRHLRAARTASISPLTLSASSGHPAEARSPAMAKSLPISSQS